MDVSNLMMSSNSQTFQNRTCSRTRCGFSERTGVCLPFKNHHADTQHCAELDAAKTVSSQGKVVIAESKCDGTFVWWLVFRDFASSLMDLDFAPAGREFVAGGFDRMAKTVRERAPGSKDVYSIPRLSRLSSVCSGLDASNV